MPTQMISQSPRGSFPQLSKHIAEKGTVWHGDFGSVNVSTYMGNNSNRTISALRACDASVVIRKKEALSHLVIQNQC